MNNDSLYPNDGEAVGIYAAEPDEQQEEQANKETTDTLLSLPVIQDVLDWFDAEIAKAWSIEDIVLDDTMSDSNIARQVMVNRLLHDALTKKRAELQGWFDAWRAEQKEKRNGAA